MSQQLKVTRALDLQRGGSKGNMAAPVILMTCKNTSGNSLARGDVVVWDKTSNSTADVISVTTTTSQNNKDVFGMVYDASIASNALGKVQVWGPTDALKVDGTTDIAIGDYLGTFTTAKIASKTTGGGMFARAMEAYATNDSSGVIDAFIQCMQGAMPSASVSTLADAASLTLGDSSDVSIQWDGDTFEVQPAADDTVMNIGDGTESFDVVIFGNTSDDKLTWDASANTLHLTDGEKLGFGNTSATPDISINWDGTDLEITANAADSVINFGGAAQIDLNIVGNTTDDSVYWDGSGNTLNLSDGVKLGFGNVATNPDISINWDGTDLEIAAATADSVVNFGGATQMDVKLFGNTTDDSAYWDGSGNILSLSDGVKIGFGNVATNPDISINWDGTDLEITAAAADSVINFGGTAQMDVKLFGNTTDDSAYWDGSGNTLGLSDGVKIGFGNNATTPDVSINWDGTDLEVAVQADDSAINIGNGTASADVKIFGNTSDLFALWDASASILQLQDATKLGFGNISTDPDVSITWDGTDLEVALKTDDSAINFGNGTNSPDVKLFGNTTAAFTYWDASANTLFLADATKIGFGNESTDPDVSITWDGTDIEIALKTDDSVINVGNGTASADVKIFGNTTADYALFDASANNLDLLGAYDLRIQNIGTLDFPASAAGNTTFTVSGLTSNDVVILSPREGTVGALVVDKVAANQLTIRNTASETSNVEVNYYVIAKAS